MTQPGTPVSGTDAGTGAGTDALLIIDMQEWILSLPLRPATGPELTVAIADALAAWRESGRPVIWVTYLRLDGSDGGPSGSARIADGLVVEDGDHHIVKYGIDAFDGTDLRELLATFGVTRLILSGVATDQAVIRTAETGTRLGFSVVAPAALSTTTRVAAHGAALAHMRSIGVLTDVDPTRLKELQ